MRAVALVIAMSLALVACGGSTDPDSQSADSADSADSAGDSGDRVSAAAPAATTPIPDPTTVVIPTSTPLATPTPLPTSTPLPLDSPTPSAILFGSAFTNDSKVTTVGIDEVFFGMTADDAAAAASTTWVGAPSGNSNCYKVAPENGPSGIELWIVDGFVERIDITHPDLRTPSGLGVGRTLAELQSQLGDRLGHETADDDTVVATFTPADEGDRDFRIVFELVEDSVLRYRTGRVGIIDRPADYCPSTIGTTDPQAPADSTEETE